MTREVKLNRLETVLSDLDYPVSREAIATDCTDVTLVLSEGTENLGELIAESNDDTFDSRDDLANEIWNLLPQDAVGEPY